jgi:hypothetical protein
MGWDLIRLDWPNSAAILALALVPLVAMTFDTDTQASRAAHDPASLEDTTRTAQVPALENGVIFMQSAAE